MSTPHLQYRSGSSARGQVLPLFALFLVVLLGFSALAIDVSGALSARRFYRSAADAASLAGGQDLQQGAGRAVSDTERTNARRHAMERLVSLMGATSTPSCPPAADIVDCALPGTGFRVSIKTPSPSCVTCDPKRSVQVTVRNPAYGLTFSRLFGQAAWNVASTSVAGLTYSKSYTIVTLRPPKNLGGPAFDVDDIIINGGTVVTVSIGDVGSNSNMTYAGTGSLLVLNPDYAMYYFDPLSGPRWSPSPAGNKITQLIADPNYQYPSMVNAPTWADARELQANTAGSPATTASVSATCLAEWNKVDKTRYALLAATPLARVYCYEAGIYDGSRAQLVSGTGNVALLKPGVYYLKKGADIGGSLLGGYQPGSPGVALMFDECFTTQCAFTGNNANIVALNAGTKFPPSFAGGSPATAALDWEGALVQTSGPDSPTPPILMTLLVKKDPNCFVPTSAPWVEPSRCNASRNTTVFVGGSGGLVLEGVQYLPTDNARITGNSGSIGRVGQIISWTLTYSGGVRINQEGTDNGGPGILRLDAACTAPATVCVSP